MCAAYFAYGSNLSSERLLGRCPGASEPRPAVLADHVWLINERGVATIEPVAGHEVHGVVWDVTDEDLVTLDRVEGVPDRYARTRCVVERDGGPVEAVVYVDPRTEPGPPRAGYLEIVLAGAAEHGLPEHWIEHLSAWDRARWAAFESSRIRPGGPGSLRDLLAAPGVRETLELRSTFGFLAIHGGHLEVMTDVIARRAAAAAGASFYGVHHPEEHRHHLPSTRFDPEESRALAAFLDHVEIVVSVHGYGRKGRWLQLLAGGSNRELAQHVATHVGPALPGYHVVTELDDIPTELRGMHAANPVNRPRHGGVQLELPPRVRGTSPRSPKAGPDGISPIVHDLVAGLAAAARSWAGPATLS